MNKIFFPYYWRWSKIRYYFGQVTYNEDLKLMYVNIPKNATNWVHNILHHNNWNNGNYNKLEVDFTDYKIFAVIRDPYERYISGLAEYLHLYHDNKLVSDEAFEILFDLITVDDHTDLQISFLHGLDFDKTTFIMCDENLSKNMTDKIFKPYNIKFTEELLKPFYVSAKDPKYHLPLQQHIKSKITPEIEEKIKDHFKSDYQLINIIQHEKHD